jgi:hypothetical protein
MLSSLAAATLNHGHFSTAKRWFERLIGMQSNIDPKNDERMKSQKLALDG